MHTDIFKSKIAEHEKAGPGPSAGIAGQYNRLVRCDAAVFSGQREAAPVVSVPHDPCRGRTPEISPSPESFCSEGPGVFGYFFGLIQGADVNDDHIQGVQILADPVIINYEFIFRFKFKRRRRRYNSVLGQGKTCQSPALNTAFEK